MSSQYGELRPTSGWDRFVSLAHPSKFQRVSRLGCFTAATSLNGSQTNFAQCLAVFCVGTLYIHFRRLLPRYGILPGKIHFASKSCALLYCQRYCTVHSTRVVGVSQILRRWAEGATYIWQGGHHVGNWLRSTFVVFSREIANCWKLPTCYKHLASIQNLLSVRLTSATATLWWFTAARKPLK